MTTTQPTDTWCTPPMGVANETACLLAPMHAGLCEPPVPTHPTAEGADAEAATSIQALFREALADAGVANPEQYAVAYDTTPLRPTSAPITQGAPMTTTPAPTTYLDMPVVRCGTDVSHMAHVYPVDGVKTVCRGLLPHSVPLDAERQVEQAYELSQVHEDNQRLCEELAKTRAAHDALLRDRDEWESDNCELAEERDKANAAADKAEQERDAAREELAKFRTELATTTLQRDTWREMWQQRMAEVEALTPKLAAARAELATALPFLRDGALAEHHRKCGEASQFDIRRCEDADCLERAHLLEAHGLIPEEWGAYLATTPCGSANPDMPFATCTYPNGHGPIRVDLRDLGERDMDHGDETRGLLWNGTTAMIWAEAPLPTPVDADVNPATTDEPADEPKATCGHAYIGNEGEFTCDLYAPHNGKQHWNSLAEFAWTDERAA